MSFVYHLVPDPMVGDFLTPLNEMDQSSAIHQQHAKKYLGREALMNVIIPKLNCRWNDVVQFSALDPQIILDQLREVDPTLKLFRSKYFKVPIELLVSQYSVVTRTYLEKPQKGDFSIKEDEVTFTSIENYRELNTVPKLTTDYWQWAKNNNEKLLWFPFIPHIFVKGKVNIINFDICEFRI